jgi:hypothetical protein
MRYSVEIMLRGNPTVFAEHVHHIGNDVVNWNQEDAATLLRSMLAALDKAQNPGRDEPPAVALRGMNWVVSPYQDGVVVALEIHSGCAVAGPFAIDQQHLEHLLAEAMKSEASAHSTTVH